MIIRIISVLCLLFFAQSVQAACSGTDLRNSLTSQEQAHLHEVLSATPNANGNHWRATKNTHVIHLVGTIHVSDPRLEGPIDRLRDIVEGADLLLLEVTEEDKLALQSRMSTDPDILIMPDATLPDLLSEADWDKMSKALKARGLPPFMASRFQPWYVSMLLAMPPCIPLEEFSQIGLDSRIEAIAKNAGIERAALENVDSIFSIFSDQPRDLQIDMMLSALVAPDVSEDLFATLLASYFDEAPAESWIVSNLMGERFSPIEQETSAEIFKTLEQKLLVDRNRAWIPVLLDASDRNGRVVAAFGAAHLPGKDGVVALLEAEGFSLERLPF